MSEFMEKHSVSRLIGSPPGYVGYEEAGQLTEKIRRRPYSVVLFDEIEKAHPDVLNVLLQILDDGRVTDAQGRSVNFENTVVVMTTNAGSGKAASSLGFTASESEAEKGRIEKALLEFLRPEFINRVDEVIVFNSLSIKDFSSIVKIMLSDLASVLSDRNISFTYTDAAAHLIAEESYSVKYGARNMRRYIQRNVEDPIAEAIISDTYGTTSVINLSVKDGKLSVDCK
jgi:ATP-dependent Clp protease ATP-binding subunit ClpA